MKDRLGKEIKVGSRVAYSTTMGCTPILRLGTVVGLVDNPEWPHRYPRQEGTPWSDGEHRIVVEPDPDDPYSTTKNVTLSFPARLIVIE